MPDVLGYEYYTINYLKGYIFPNEGAHSVNFFLLELNLHAIIIILIIIEFYLNDIIIPRK